MTRPRPAPCAIALLQASLLASLLTACQGPADAPAESPPDAGSAAGAIDSPAATAGEPHAQVPADAFLSRLGSLCGKAFAGRVVADTPPPAGDDPFAGKPLVMHVRDCGEEVVRIPFHVGDDRSRTWVITRTADGLRLKHDHRHEDGSEDVLTMYGGDSVDAGSAGRQTFPADAESRDLFTREGIEVSNANVWAMEVEPGSTFTYELSRPNRLFRVEFDLSRPVELPPPAWGYAAE